MTREKTIKEILKYFDDNEEIFEECIEELDDYDGFLYDDRYFYIEDIDELFSGCTPTEILDRAFYGYDEDTYTTNSIGEKEYAPFNTNRTYFHYNGCGNLISTDYKDYSNYLYDNVIEDMNENRQYIDTINDNDELSDLFDMLDECDD